MIYLVEDDENIRELVTYTLNNSGLDTQGFPTSREFWKAMDIQKPSAVLLDIMLPGEDGLSVLKKLRANPTTEKLPVILLTAKSGEYDKVKGFDLGADDYVPKPFSMAELLARVKALLRRTSSSIIPCEYSVRNLFVSVDKHIVKVDGEKISLTLKEFDLLCYLLEHNDTVLSRDRILTKIWGYSFDGESRTVDVHIRTLRQKLGAAGDLIRTVRGIGYKIGD